MLNPAKIYTIDTGLLNAISYRNSANNGLLLENIVFMQLRRNGYIVEYINTFILLDLFVVINISVPLLSCADSVSYRCTPVDTVTCPLHNWRINLADGQAVAPDEGCAGHFKVDVDADGELVLDIIESDYSQQ